MYKVNYIAIGAVIPLLFDIDKPSPEFAVMLLEEILTKNKNLFVVGFKFYNEKLEEISGTYFLRGKVYNYPQIDESCKSLFKLTSTEYELGKSIILIKEPYPSVFPYNEEDTLLDYTKMLLSFKEVEITNLLDEITDLLEPREEELKNIILSIEKHAGVGDNDITEESKVKRFTLGVELLSILRQLRELRG